jgi:hypothetical protein
MTHDDREQAVSRVREWLNTHNNFTDRLIIRTPHPGDFDCLATFRLEVTPIYLWTQEQQL